MLLGITRATNFWVTWARLCGLSYENKAPLEQLLADIASNILRNYQSAFGHHHLRKIEAVEVHRLEKIRNTSTACDQITRVLVVWPTMIGR